MKNKRLGAAEVARRNRRCTSDARPSGDTHVFEPGDKVTVYHIALCARPFIEGDATIIDAVARFPNLYRVRFMHETLPAIRLVHPGQWQSDPDRLLADLMGHWRGTVAPETFGRLPGDLSGFAEERLRKR